MIEHCKTKTQKHKICSTKSNPKDSVLNDYTSFIGLNKLGTYIIGLISRNIHYWFDFNLIQI